MSNDYDDIRSRMLDTITLDIDKREGSFTSDMISPIALELAQVYLSLEDLVKMAFVEEGFFDNLDAKCSEYGINRKNGVFATGVATITGIANTEIEENTPLHKDELYFLTTESVTIPSTGTVDVNIEATEDGTDYNLLKDTELSLVEDNPNIESIIVKNDITNGADIESDEELRERFFDTIKKSYTSGNKADYEKWVSEVEGVGRYKVTPLKYGNGTVGITITNAEMAGADTTLITKVSNYIETLRPIGATVTVTSAIEDSINVSATITLATGYTLDDVKEEFRKNLKEYFKSISLDGKTTYVSIAKVGNALFDVAGVFDYSDLKLNNASNNIAIATDHIPKVNIITFTESDS